MSQQWLFRSDDLKKTPSRQDGTCKRGMDERIQRAKGCRFIFDVGTELRLPQYTIAAACVFLHRFYMRNSLAQFRIYEVAATCLFLACKIEESMRKCQDFIIKTAKVAMKNPSANIEPGSKEYIKWQEIILRLEDTILESLCFDLHIELPYSWLPTLLQERILMSPSCPSWLHKEQKNVMLLAWAWLNDSLRSYALVFFQPDAVAAAALILTIHAFQTYFDPSSTTFQSLLRDAETGDEQEGTDKRKDVGVPGMVPESVIHELCGWMRQSVDHVTGAIKEMLMTYEVREVRHTLEARFEWDEMRRALDGEKLGTELSVHLVREFLVKYRPGLYPKEVHQEEPMDMEEGEVSE